MAPTRINIRQIRLGPDVPLGRRGCRVESSLSHEDVSGWDDTYFKCAADDGGNQLRQVIDILRSRGEEVFTVLKTILHDPARSFNESQRQTLDELVKLGVVRWDFETECMSLTNPTGTWGACLECATLIALEDLHIQALREVTIEYPYPSNRYDPDGQKYDILAGLDWSQLLWIECKKPLYLREGENPLGSVVSKDTVQKFYRRTRYLRPTIAVFLVDTLEDYHEVLQSLFTAEFWESSGCVCMPVPAAHQIIARLHGFIYFVRVEYQSSRDYVRALRESVSQVLHDARQDWPMIGFSGDPFRDKSV